MFLLTVGHLVHIIKKSGVLRMRMRIKPERSLRGILVGLVLCLGSLLYGLEGTYPFWLRLDAEDSFDLYVPGKDTVLSHAYEEDIGDRGIHHVADAKVSVGSAGVKSVSLSYKGYLSSPEDSTRLSYWLSYTQGSMTSPKTVETIETNGLKSNTLSITVSNTDVGGLLPICGIYASLSDEGIAAMDEALSGVTYADTISVTWYGGN